MLFSVPGDSTSLMVPPGVPSGYSGLFSTSPGWVSLFLWSKTSEVARAYSRARAESNLAAAQLRCTKKYIRPNSGMQANRPLQSGTAGCLCSCLVIVIRWTPGKICLRDLLLKCINSGKNKLLPESVCLNMKLHGVARERINNTFCNVEKLATLNCTVPLLFLRHVLRNVTSVYWAHPYFLSKFRRLLKVARDC